MGRDFMFLHRDLRLVSFPRAD